MNICVIREYLISLDAYFVSKETTKYVFNLISTLEIH